MAPSLKLYNTQCALIKCTTLNADLDNLVKLIEWIAAFIFINNVT